MGDLRGYFHTYLLAIPFPRSTISEKLDVVRTCFLRLDRPGFRAAQLGHGGQVLDSDLRVYGNFLTCFRRGMILVPADCVRPTAVHFY
jgi:hypothetical protein